MNTTAKKFNLAVGILAIACILLTGLITAISIIVLNHYGNGNGNDAGTAISLVLIMVLFFWPVLVLSLLMNLVSLAMGITMLATIKGAETSRKAICVTAAVMEIIPAILLMLINILMVIATPVLIANFILALLMLGIGIATCVFAAKYARKKEI